MNELQAGPVPHNIHDAPEEELVVQKTGEPLTLAKSLSAPFGLRALLVHQEVLAPGRRASGYHHHTHKEELFYVLGGRPSLLVGGAWLELKPGDFIGFPPSPQAPHMLANRSEEEAVILTIGTNPEGDQIVYCQAPDVDQANEDSAAWPTVHALPSLTARRLPQRW